MADHYELIATRDNIDDAYALAEKFIATIKAAKSPHLVRVMPVCIGSARGYRLWTNGIYTVLEDAEEDETETLNDSHLLSRGRQ